MTTEHRQRRTAGWSPRLPIELSEAPDLFTASTMLARHGIPVFPCVPGGKQPLTSHGFHDATAELATVQAWWGRCPDANIGMPTGAASGVDVVDVDVHPAGSGFSSFEKARAAGHAEGWAWLVRTPSSGIHAYFLRTTEAEQRSWQVPSQHIDFRGDGGYIVVPPSVVTKADSGTGRYELIAIAQHSAEPVDAVALRAFLDPPPLARPPGGMPLMGARPEALAAYVAGRPEGSRNFSLYWAACRMVEDGHRFDTTASVLGDAAQSAGLSDREATNTIRSAYRHTSPRSATPLPRPTTREAMAL